MAASDYDVIVVGGGGSGLAAAVSAADLGGRVLLLEKQPQLGGTTGIAVGSFTAAGTRMQRDAGIEDNNDAHAEDATKFAAAEIEARNHESLRRYFLSEAAETLDWLRGLGLSFYGPSPEPPNRVPRMHNVVPGAKAYIAALQMALLKRGATILCNADVVELLRDGGRVIGVRAKVDRSKAEFRAVRGVVLAAGDYASGTELIRRHKGDRFSRIEGINAKATGDGHRLVEAAGGKLLNMDVTYGPELRFVASSKRPFQQMLPVGRWSGRFMAAAARLMPQAIMRRLIKRLLVTWQHPEDALFDDGAILVNAGGERFVDERTWPERELAVAEQSAQVCYIVLDGRLVERYSAWPHFISTAPDIAYAYVKDYERLRPDVTARGDSLEDIARKRGLDPRKLQAAAQQSSLERGPWVLLGPAKAYFTTTEGGAAIDESLQVLDDAGEAIGGLYAVGQNGLGGMILWGHGLHIAWAMTSGRLVGRAIMQKT